VGACRALAASLTARDSSPEPVAGRLRLQSVGHLKLQATPFRICCLVTLWVVAGIGVVTFLVGFLFVLFM